MNSIYIGLGFAAFVIITAFVVKFFYKGEKDEAGTQTKKDI